MDCTVGIGLLGCGTVGASVAQRLLSERDAIERRSGVRYKLQAIAIANPSKPRPAVDRSGALHQERARRHRRSARRSDRRSDRRHARRLRAARIRARTRPHGRHRQQRSHRHARPAPLCPRPFARRAAALRSCRLRGDSGDPRRSTMRSPATASTPSAAWSTARAPIFSRRWNAARTTTSRCAARKNWALPKSIRPATSRASTRRTNSRCSCSSRFKWR